MRGVSQRADSAPGSTRAKGKSDRWQRCIVVGGILCLLGTGYAVTGAVAEGFLFWAAPIDTVEAAVWINGHLKAAKLVAVHPDRFVSAFGYWLRRPMAAADERHALLFGAEQSEFTDARAGLRSAYEAPTAIEAAEDFDALAVDVVLVAVGSSPPSWAASPCFREAHRNDTWLIVQRTLDGCPTGGERR